MARNKHQSQKPKPKRQPTVKQHGKQADIAHFRSQLDALGLKIIRVTADGNCFFRALADQLEGNEEEHGKYRQMVVQHILKHREEFEPFIEDDAPFDEYCKSMEKDGTWAGHMELQAASLVTCSNICIHHIMSPRWYIQNFDRPGTRMIHLSYHDGEHYNSIRLKEDSCNGPAWPIVIKADTDISAESHQVKANVTRSIGTSSTHVTDTTAVKIVMAGTGCGDADKVKQILQELDGDIDAAIEFLMAGHATDENAVEHNDLPHENDSLSVLIDDGHCEEPKMESQCKSSEHSNADDISVHHGDSSQHDDKASTSNKIPRNKTCPCGSKKKYKSCCGSGTRKSSTEFVMYVA
eukprot:TRINITY_DN15704_c0_g1_i26.p1 TRINITY_DN15704_c0_g1~~TRINITY_DN15704_c0_g1_i26.p1  ORF type:complete len:400 (-),score=88.50 TRINITY_DN15704_c0_g1_i26:234-1286(-)